MRPERRDLIAGALLLAACAAGLALAFAAHARAGLALLSLAALLAIARGFAPRRGPAPPRGLQRTATAGLVAAGLAHELKNALMVLQGFAELARSSAERGAPEERTLAQLREVEAGARDAVLLLRRFTAYASGEPAPRQPVGAEVLARESLRLVRPLARLRGLAVEAGPAPDLTLVCDPAAVQQILLNLLLNALDFARTRLSLSVAAAGGAAVFAVEDDGPGVPAAVRAHLFEPFRTTRPEGSGLGLSSSRELAREHGGTLELEERAGGGARFVLRLPIAEVAGSAPESRPEGPPGGPLWNRGGPG